MDPISIIGLVGSVVGVTDVIARSIKGLIGLQARYKTADTHVVLVMGYLQLIESALDEVSEFIEGLKEPSQHAKLLGKINFAIDCFAIPLGSLSEKVEALQANTSDDKLTVKGKLSFLLGEDEMKLISAHLGNVVPAFNLLLSAANSKSQQQCLAILQGEETRSALKQIEDDSSSYIQHDVESASVMTRRSIVSEHTELLDSTFEFDNDLFNSQVYKHAFRAIVEEQKLRRLGRRPKGTQLRAAKETPFSVPSGSANALDRVERSELRNAVSGPRPDKDSSYQSHSYTAPDERSDVETDLAKEGAMAATEEDSLSFRDWLTTPMQTLDLSLANVRDDESFQQHDEAAVRPEGSDLPNTMEQAVLIATDARYNDTARPSSLYSNYTITPSRVASAELVTVTEPSGVESESSPTMPTQDDGHEPGLQVMVANHTSPGQETSLSSLTLEKVQPSLLTDEGRTAKSAKKRGLSLLSRFLATETRSAKAARQRSEETDRQIRAEFIRQLSEFKILLLGAGASGRDALLKNFKLKYAGSYTKGERDSYKDAIWSKTIMGARIVLEAMETFEIPLENASLGDFVKIISTAPNQVEWIYFEPVVADAIIALRENAGFKACMARSREYHTDASDHYLLQHVERISGPGYVPTDEDIIRHYYKTTGITETVYSVDDMIFHLFNTGGYRSERKKWIHCFENASVVLFHVDISEYDLQLYEDETVNRMQESLTLFDSISNSRWFVKTQIVLVFTKVDILLEKLPKSPLKDYCPDFDGSSAAEAIEYIRNRYLGLVQAKDRVVDTYVVNLTNTESSSGVLTQIVKSIKAFSKEQQRVARRELAV